MLSTRARTRAPARTLTRALLAVLLVGGLGSAHG